MAELEVGPLGSAGIILSTFCCCRSSYVPGEPPRQTTFQPLGSWRH